MPAINLLLAATELEAAPLRAAAAGRADVVIEVLGVGSQGAARLRQLMQEHRPARAIAFGLAGSLVPDVRVGDTVVARRWLDERGDEVAVSGGFGPDLLAALRRSPIRAHAGDVVTVAAPLHGRQARDQMRRHTGAIAVQMEDAHWAPLAMPGAVSVRVISDDCDLPLPLPRHRLLHPEGGVRWLLWAREALRHDGIAGLRGAWRRLRRARREWITAMHSLAALAEVVVDAIAPPQ